MKNKKVEIQTLKLLCESMSTPVTQQILEYIKSNDVISILKMKIDKNAYAPEDYQEFRHDYLCTSFLQRSTYNNLVNVEELHVQCVNDFFINEKTCRDNAINFQKLLRSDTLIEVVRAHLESILGSLTKYDLSFAFRNMRFGPGSTLNVSITGKVPSEKFSVFPTYTTSLKSFLPALLGKNWFYSLVESVTDSVHCHINKNDFESLLATEINKYEVGYNRFTSVPKNTFKRRPICIEPGLNSFFQLGVGKLIRSKLKRSGVDLDLGQTHNRELASVCHIIDGATIDLKGASDSVSRGIVEMLFNTPTLLPWLHLLNVGRTPNTEIEVDGVKQIVPLQKFSSMGNGYTFELESLIFWALVRTCVPVGELSYTAVYGDDIIVPRVYADDLISLLKVYGFTTNVEKTFISGLFFESCGFDYFNGYYCRPVFSSGVTESVRVTNAKDLVSPQRHCSPFNVAVDPDDRSEVIKTANRIRMYCNLTSHFPGEYCRSRYYKAYKFLYELATRNFVVYLCPPGYNDDNLQVSFFDYSKQVAPLKDRNGREGYTVTLSSQKTTKKTDSTDFYLYYELHRLTLTDKPRDIPTYGRQALSRTSYLLKKAEVFIPIWDDHFRFSFID